uniref:Histone-lysine N-methyltransferase SETMAR n=2 Tax=Anopheles funestus TaxID=62324 RepID=A0A182RXW6_ANOFN
VKFHHDNARPHTANVTLDLLKKFGWDIIDHPPYSNDVAPSDYHMFPALKKHLGGKKFESDAEVQKEVNTWLREADGEWYSAGIDKFIVRMRKVLEKNGDYVEK